ncbi:MAG: alpha/beta fold hydrolase [Rhodospirillaceae bacterium]
MLKYYKDGPFGQVHIRELGEGPALVLLHQTAWSSLQFKNAMPHLAARGLRCIAVDTPGFGMSDGPGEPPSVTDYADSLAVVIEALDLDRPTVLGHHTGASIAMAFATAYPGVAGRLVLHGIPIYTEEERAQRLAKPHYDQAPKEDGSHIADRWHYANAVSGNMASHEAIHWSLVQFFWAGPNEWFGHHAAFKYDIETDFKALTVPTIIISNSGDILHSKIPYLKSIRRDLTFATIDGGTFHIVFEEAERWATITADLILGSIDEY